MGGRSKSKSSSNTQQQTNATMNSLSNQASKFSDAAKGYGNLQTAMMGQIFPAFGEMVGGAMKSFGENPMANFMGAALGMPIQMETPDFVQSFVDKYKPQEPATPVEQAPQPYNVNDDMRMRMGMGGPYGQYNINRPGLFGGVRR